MANNSKDIETHDFYNKYTVAELKDKLTARDLSTDGKKQELIVRLTEYEQSHNGSEMVGEVTKSKLDVNTQNSRGFSALHEVVAKSYTWYSKPEENSKLEEEDINTLKLLVKFNPDLKALTSAGENILHLAIKNERSLEMVEFITKLLSDNGVDINLADKEGCTALYYAVSPISFDNTVSEKYSDFNFKFRDVTIVKHLIEKGAKIDTSAKNGYNPLFMAVVMQKTDYVRVMLEEKDTLPLPEGILEKTTNIYCIAASYYQRTYNYPPKEYYSMTPLQIAVYDENKEMAQMLIKAGATMNAVDTHTSYDNYDRYNKMTPLLISVHKCNQEMAQILISAGVNMNAVNKHGDNALHMIIKGNIDYEKGNASEKPTLLAKLLIDSGIDLNAKDLSGETALHYAIRNSKKEILNYILEQGLAAL